MSGLFLYGRKKDENKEVSTRDARGVAVLEVDVEEEGILLRGS